MNVPNDPYLRAAYQSLQKGEREKAQTLLASMLAQNPINVEAWFLLSQAVDEPRAIAGCLRNILAINPHHDAATKKMAQLEQQLALQPLQVMRVGAGSAAVGQTCPYCSSGFKAMEEVVGCFQCEMSHHFECWQQNNHTCATMLCSGFSLSEVYQQPLPLQPPQPDAKVIVIRKQDIPNVTPVSRKEKEQRFQRRLLLMALMAEEGNLPPGQAGPLPSVDDLLDQIQRERDPNNQVAQPSQTTAPPKFCSACGHAYPRPQSKFCMNCGQPR